MTKRTAADREIERAEREANMASVRNYPPLGAWLEKMGATCVSQVKGARESVIEMHTVGACLFVVVIHAKGAGWDVFTSHASNSVDLALSDAEARIRNPQPNRERGLIYTALSGNFETIDDVIAEYEANPVEPVTLREEG